MLRSYMACANDHASHHNTTTVIDTPSVHEMDPRSAQAWVTLGSQPLSHRQRRTGCIMFPVTDHNGLLCLQHDTRVLYSD